MYTTNVILVPPPIQALDGPTFSQDVTALNVISNIDSETLSF